MGQLYHKCKTQYIMRLDDAAPHANWENWDRMEQLLGMYGIRPLAGVIPDCRDPVLNAYGERADFWEGVRQWEKGKAWTVAMHGYDHVYISKDGGIHPVNHFSEFAGVPFEIQRKKIREGVRIFREHGLNPSVFFAPGHTMDRNTIEALKQESRIRIISDTAADRPYQRWGMTFVPQQSGAVRKLPFRMVTFCYHPNVMTDREFAVLEQFLKKEAGKFIPFPLEISHRKKNVYDWILERMYLDRMYTKAWLYRKTGGT